MEGDHISNSVYDIRFRGMRILFLRTLLALLLLKFLGHITVPIAWQQLCELHLTPSEIQQFRQAIDKAYYFEFFVDDLPVRGFVGIKEQREDGDASYFLFKHLHFTILYNGDRVIHANVTSDSRQVIDLGSGKENKDLIVEFSYSVKWIMTTTSYEKRMELFRDNFFEADLDIHWLSILNSFVLVLLLTGFVVLILRRVLHSDFDRYARRSDNPDEELDDSGWKLVHGDVFRLPENVTILAAFCGAGVHLLLLGVIGMILALAGYFPFGDSGAAYATLIFLYAFTSFFGGLVSAAVHRHFKGPAWHWNVVLESAIFTGPFMLVILTINVVSAAYKVTNTLSVEMIATLFFIWLLLAFPLAVLGAIAGRRLVHEYAPPLRVSNFVRTIPNAPLHRSVYVQFLGAGFLPFSAIYIELYYVYLSVWGHNSYTLYGILLLVLIILLCVTSAMTVAMVYFQLSQEDHHWWWRSFLNGSATGVFVYAYSIFYYFFRSSMTGFLQAAVYFLYMLLVSYAFSLVLGTAGFLSAFIFVNSIYRNLKIE